MSGASFLNIKAPRELLDRLDDYRFAMRKPSRAEAARELLDQALKTFFEASHAEPVRPGDPDYRLVRTRQKEPSVPIPIKEIEVRLARLKRAKTG